MSSDSKRGGPPSTGGESDRTVMLTADQVEGNATAQGLPAFQETAPEPGMSDATELGVQLPPELQERLREPETVDEARPAPRARTGTRPALAEPGAAPRAKTGQRPALQDPGAKPRGATGQRRALQPEGEAPASGDKTLPPSNKRGATGQRKALAPQPEPQADPSLGGETMMLGEGGGPLEESNETRIFSGGAAPSGALATDDPDTVGRGLAGDDAPTQNKRPLQDLVDNVPEPQDPAPRGKRAKAGAGPQTVLSETNKGLHGMQLVIGAVLLLFAGAVGARFAFHATAKPGDDELRLLYPFGNRGGVLSNGRSAPGADEVEFRYDGAEDCDDARCLRFHAYEPGKSFDFLMVVRQTDDGWAFVPERSSPTH